jgi:hypothetical protein
VLVIATISSFVKKKKIVWVNCSLHVWSSCYLDAGEWFILFVVIEGCVLSEYLLLLLALQSTVNLGLFHDYSPLVPILCLSSPLSKAHYLQIFLD